MPPPRLVPESLPELLIWVGVMHVGGGYGNIGLPIIDEGTLCLSSDLSRNGTFTVGGGTTIINTGPINTNDDASTFISNRCHC